MLKTLLAGAAVLAMTASFAHAQSPSAADPDFVKKAAVGNMFEIEEAKLAVERASDPKLKEFAETMLRDHGDALKALQETADEAKNAALDEPHQAMLDNLKSFNGADFDKIYKADQVQAHTETVALLSDYQENGQNDDLQDWVDDVLPTVMDHRKMINAM